MIKEVFFIRFQPKYQRKMSTIRFNVSYLNLLQNSFHMSLIIYKNLGQVNHKIHFKMTFQLSYWRHLWLMKKQLIFIFQHKMFTINQEQWWLLNSNLKPKIQKLSLSSLMNTLKEKGKLEHLRLLERSCL